MFSCTVTSYTRTISAVVLLVAYLSHASKLSPDVITSSSDSSRNPATSDDELPPEVSVVDSFDESLSDSAIDHLTRVFGIGHVTMAEVSRDELVDAHSQLQQQQTNRVRHRRSPPEYMVQLYKAVAYSDGISKTANPYEADLVRGISDKASSDQVRYHFNVSHINHTEEVLEAELHLFKMRVGTSSLSEFRHRGSPLAQHIVEVRLYEVLSEEARETIAATQGQMPSIEQLRLLVQRRVSAHRNGWEVFKIRDTVRKWIEDPSTNHGLLVSTRTASGELVNGTLIRFAQKSEHHDSKQPVLVVFSDENHLETEPGFNEEDDFQPPIVTDSNLKTIRRNYVNFLNEAYRAQHGAGPLAVGPAKRTRIRRPNTYYMNPVVHQRLVNESTTAAGSTPRQRRSSSSDGSLESQQTSRSSPAAAFHQTPSRRRKRTCQRHEMYVDFEKIGWAGWIISPKGYNAYQCRGVCPFPLGQNQHPSNHATVQSIVHALRIAPSPSASGGGGLDGTQSGVDTPCCVPNKLYSISLLYFDDDENVILKQYDEMVAASCGCH